MGDVRELANGNSTPSSVTDQKPVLVAAAFPASGHSKNLVRVAGQLAKKGYTIYFIAGSEFRSSIEKHGIHYIEHPWEWESRESPLPDHPDKTIVGPRLFAYAMKHVFIDSAPLAYKLLNSTLERVRAEHPDREVVILNEALFFAVQVYNQGAPLPKGYTALPKVINFHTSVDARTDPEVPPFGPGLPYDPTPENRAVWSAIYQSMEPINAALSDHANEIFKLLGATRDITEPFLDGILTLGETTLLFTTPSTDYPPRSKTPSHVQYIGALPLEPLNPNLTYPPWWSPLLLSNAALPLTSPARKKVIFVSQGTAHTDYDDLLIPALKAFAPYPNFIVIAVLGKRNASLANFPVPDNARVLDYFPYDAVLPYADVFVSNAGYNGYMHGVMNGVPMILAGTLADKAEVAARAEYVGMGINLRMGRATEEALRAAVERLWGGDREGEGEGEYSRFKEAAERLRRENEAMDPVGEVERVIGEVLGGGGGGGGGGAGGKV